MYQDEIDDEIDGGLVNSKDEMEDTNGGILNLDNEDGNGIFFYNIVIS